MPERPFKVRLVLLDTEYAGRRFRVDGQHFVLGRHDDCDLQLPSSSLSRRHCEIVLNDETPSVLVRDLSSRNGTFINDRKLDANELVELFHHDVLRIGRMSFRLSIKDRLSGEPLISTSAGRADPLASLLSELDEMVDDPSIEDVVKPSGLLAIPKQESKPVPQASSTVVVEPADSIVDSNMETTQITDTVSTEYGANADPAAVANADEDESSKTNAKKEPMKLPEHLRRRSADSQEAATEALKRLFSGGW